MAHSNALPLLAAASFALLSGCAGDLEEDVASAVVSSALESSRTGNAGSFLTEVEAPPDESCVSDPSFAAHDAAARPTVGLYPAECLAKSADGASLHAQFAACTGAFGRVELNGGVDAVFRPGQECSVHADVVDSGDLTANGRALDYQASAEIRFDNGRRLVDWNAHWTGTTRRGREIEQTSAYAVVNDDETGCIRIDGGAEGSVGSWEFATTVSALAICPAQCPAAGTVEATLVGEMRDRTIHVEFDGSELAKVTGWSGREFDVEMVCAGEEPEA